jgi:2-polyprenyl-3-methyl-5-hydroxy-6-metoxy-1,4-benzoquinol methylase
MVARLEAEPGARVLDVAAGTGLISRLLEARSYEVVGSYPGSPDT